MKNRWQKLTVLGLGSLVLLLSYNNCSNQFSTGEDIVLESSLTEGASTGSGGGNSPIFGEGTCDQDLKLLFANGYHSFLKTNCALCHSNGPGKGRFSSPNIDDALGDFMQTGYAKVSDNSISPNHNPPYSGSQHVQQINELRIEWQKGLTDYARCNGTPIDTAPVLHLEDILTLDTSTKQLPSTLDFGQNATLSWNLATDLTRIKGTEDLPNVPGAKFSIQVGKYKTMGGSTYYTFTLPRVYESTVDVRVKVIAVRLNGRLLTFPTTFRYLDASVYKNSRQDSSGLLTTGSLVAPAAMSSQDNISVSFENVEATVLPAPKPPVQASISSSIMNWVTPTTGSANITVQLNTAPDLPVTITISADTSNLCSSTNANAAVDINTCNTALANFICTSAGCPQTRTLTLARSVVGPTGTFNRFDWDYRFTSTAITFDPGQTTKSLTIFFSKDIRKEGNRLLTMQIDSNLIGAQRGSVYKAYYVFNKMANPTPNPAIPTFTELMNPSTGILGLHCVSCHNSVNFEGKYDITDYQGMIDKKVVVPFQVESKMYIRMNPSSPQFDTTRQMPRNRPLDVELRKEVEAWILNGAPNN